MRFGTLIHRTLEHFYGPHNQQRRKPIHPAKTFARLYDQELEESQREWRNWRDEEDVWHTHRELGIAMMEGYVKEWKEQDKEYIVLSTEQRFQTEILVPRGEPKLPELSPVLCVGTLDKVLYHLPSRRLLFGDYKTTKNDPTKTPWLALDEQAGAYWAYGPAWLALEAPESLRRAMLAAVAHLPPAHRKAVATFKFDGILYDFLKKDLPDDRPTDAQGYALNLDGSISKRQPGPLFHRELIYRDAGDRKNVLHRIYEDAKEIGMVRAGQLAVKKSPDRFICIGCQFRDLCELHETGAAGWKEFKKQMYTTYDPYDSYYIDWDELE